MVNVLKPWEMAAADLPHGRAVRVDQLVSEYLYSDKYKQLSKNTKKQYLSVLKSIENFDFPNNAEFYRLMSHRIDYGFADYVSRVMAWTVKPATIQMYFSVLHNIWALGFRNGRVTMNPWGKASIKLANLRDVTWEPAQVELAVKTSKELGFDLLALYIQMAYYTAQRPFSDLRSLKWENVRQTSDGTPILDFIIQKTGTHIMLPLEQEAYKMLMSLERKSEYIFVDNKGVHRTGQCITTQFKKVKEYAKLDENLLIRDLRRSAVTEMAMAGATGSEISAITGWTCTEAMLRRYAPMRLNTAKNALSKREKFNAKPLSESPSILSEPIPASQFAR